MKLTSDKIKKKNLKFYLYSIQNKTQHGENGCFLIGMEYII